MVASASPAFGGSDADTRSRSSRACTDPEEGSQAATSSAASPIPELPEKESSSKAVLVVALVVTILLGGLAAGAWALATHLTDDDDGSSRDNLPLVLLVEQDPSAMDYGMQDMLLSSVVIALEERGVKINVSMSAVCAIDFNELLGMKVNEAIADKFTKDPSVCGVFNGTTLSLATSSNTVTVVEIDIRSTNMDEVIKTATTMDFFTAVEKGLTERGLSGYVVGAPREGCSSTAMKISMVQSSESASPMEGEPVTVEGVVVGHNPDGFFVEEEVEDQDANPKTSEGIFVKRATKPAVGMTVVVSGVVKELYGLTAIDKPKVALCPSTKKTPPTPVPTDVATEDLEHKEGMLIEVTSDLVVTDHDKLWQYGELTLAPRLARIPSDVAVPLTPEYNEQLRVNGEGVLIIEDDSRNSNPSHLSWMADSSRNDGPDIRLGTKISGIAGVLGYGYNKYRVVPNSHVTVKTDRTDEGIVAGGSGLRVGTANLYNYFNGLKVNGVVTFDYSANRGADSAEEFDLQSKKIETMLLKLDCDVIGVIEIENDGFREDSSIQELVTRVNARQADAAKHYKFVSLDVNQVGSDAITNGILYRETKVVPKGMAWTVDMPEQKFVQSDKPNWKRMRPMLVQTFTEIASGVEFAMGVVHLSSKGGSCWEDRVRDDKTDAANYAQKGCNSFRVSAAVACAEALKQRADLPKRVFLVGDFNSYTMEDPMAVLTDYTPVKHAYPIWTADKIVSPTDSDNATEGSTPAREVANGYGYVNIAKQFDPNGYSFFYGGEVGALDHILASPDLAKEVVNAGYGRINAGELEQVGYEDSLKDFPGYMSESERHATDHEPVVAVVRFAP